MKPTPAGKEKVVFQGKIFEIIHQPMKLGKKIVQFEIARRSPGLRLLIINENKILLTKEFRYEQKEWDYRLPGGKVFDTLEEYNSVLGKKEDILKKAQRVAKKECEEETGLIPLTLKHIHTTALAATLDFRLYYFVVEKFKPGNDGQKLEEGEEIKPEWYTFEHVRKMCLNGAVKEDMSVAVLLRFLANLEK